MPTDDPHDLVMELIDDKTGPHLLTKREAVEALEAIIASCQERVEALNEEIQQEESQRDQEE